MPNFSSNLTGWGLGWGSLRHPQPVDHNTCTSFTIPIPVVGLYNNGRINPNFIAQEFCNNCCGELCCKTFQNYTSLFNEDSSSTSRWNLMLTNFQWPGKECLERQRAHNQVDKAGFLLPQVHHSGGIHFWMHISSTDCTISMITGEFPGVCSNAPSSSHWDLTRWSL